MEHVREPFRGFKEIRRVLKPDGVYFFTIPYRDDRLTTSRVDVSGEDDVHTLPKVYHQDPYRREDSLVYTDFGADLPELLRPLGFDTQLIYVTDENSDIQDDLEPMKVFVAIAVNF
jgi:SAM-dependent methyltransferase